MMDIMKRALAILHRARVYTASELFVAPSDRIVHIFASDFEAFTKNVDYLISVAVEEKKLYKNQIGFYICNHGILSNAADIYDIINAVMRPQRSGTIYRYLYRPTTP